MLTIGAQFRTTPDRPEHLRFILMPMFTNRLVSVFRQTARNWNTRLGIFESERDSWKRLFD